jgi:catechol 1,2-dioxygenase
VDEITFKVAEEAKDAPTATAILCPFYRADIPYRKIGDDIVLNKPADGQMAFMHGRVTDFATKTPIMGATVWHASTNALYEHQTKLNSIWEQSSARTHVQL